MPVSKAPIREQVLAGPIDRMGVLRVRRVRSMHSLARTALQAPARRAHAIYRIAYPSPMLMGACLGSRNPTVDLLYYIVTTVGILQFFPSNIFPNPLLASPILRGPLARMPVSFW